MLRELTSEGRFESGLDSLVSGKRYAFLAVIGERYAARLAAAVENEPGYYPIPEALAHADSMLELQRHADRLNADMGLDTREAGRLVATTFAAGPARNTKAEAAIRERAARRQRARAHYNPSFQRILDQPPPLGSSIRFTDETPRPLSASARALEAWQAANGVGVLVAVQKARRSIMIRLGPAPGAGVRPNFRTFDATTPLVFTVERRLAPDEAFNLALAPGRLRKAAARAALQSRSARSDIPPV
ncbi:MAG: hypothetical protein U1E24_07530 [Phenylobacterium sp.]|nr:hypothetical protein [Phenylobacterium sp.]